ncbi:hypothetical protein FZD47_25550 [Bacillus infantis]|uniref:Uncharacterized protein n=1 Tax=Bacillus infantis TaxID=324767 RepID=A0A5D4RWQ9_9BACI|nr:hypothetical protein [Bacillus infantis]TYS55793.1 hypothetical protein FZD47_25550 [Bacillus infantis]
MSSVDVVELQREWLLQKVKDIKTQNHLNPNQKYHAVSTNYAQIVSWLSKQHGHLTLDQLKPLTEVLLAYEEAYLEE